MTAVDTAPLKELQKFIWSQGDFERMALEVMPAAEALADACGVAAGDRVLDVAAGTGNAAIAAAGRGAVAVASDLTPKMVELGRRRSEGLAIEWVEADAEALQFAASSFDRVLSCFGAMFASRPDAAAGELFRVVRPGGTVGLANWTPDSYPGRLFAVLGRHLPPPDGVPAPMLWGVEEVARARLSPHAAEVRVERRAVVIEHPSVEAMWDFQQRNLGPLAAARMALGERFADVADDVRELIAELNRATDGSVRLESGYLLVVSSAPASSERERSPSLR